MSLEENKAIVRRMIEAYNKHNLDWFDEFIAPDYFDHTNKVDREGLKQLFNMGFKGFPDWHETIEDIIAEGDKVWVRLTYTGTHTGEFFGLAPTGKKVTMTAVAIYRIVNGKLVEGRFINDGLDMLKQIGAIEYTEKGKKLFPEDVK
ncbi:MAG: ester cyclase [archaeon]|nr:ester cyclase [archaeon]